MQFLLCVFINYSFAFGAGKLFFEWAALFNATVAMFWRLSIGQWLGIVAEFTWLYCIYLSLFPSILNLFEFNKHLAPVLKTVQKIMPWNVGVLKKTRLDAGTVWWDGENFLDGNPTWQSPATILHQARLTAKNKLLDGPVEESSVICCTRLEVTLTRAHYPLKYGNSKEIVFRDDY